ncbi:putative zinc-type alcohol dehydrogenase-like protein [Pseudoduganella flava]|uniref:Alcohol dehydrogenase catalytic domain-containing protein n=1 Tax=Pseudoduganella flava TaxID=871742 RepID=A0A562PC54_9BURK|nr:NAD(P)-dependent alcohol dehydrogenase [Pseudoduganella flava]QGZ37989.1 alcohol dehydrogenase catalytic domain-containing protein [Pseudoduganella flava]TWI41810.1 putative zinc-type alcohol dehydrogenase-like protein [Pseudoduganella flava]
MTDQVHHHTHVRAYGANSADKPLEAMDIPRRAPGHHDVQIDIAFCGVCHSDLHTVRGEWAGTLYPCVPGHEIVGRVSAVGAHVSGFQVGDLVGVGCMVDSCGHCHDCEAGLENYCDGMVGTYNGKTADAPGHTLGGYSERIVVNERYVLRVRHQPDQLAAVAPLLCAGITTWSPLRHWQAGPGKKVGIVGIGGLGHMGIKLARALGAHVVAFTTSESKRADAEALGAHEVVVSRDAAAMAAQARSLDLIVNTVAAPHDLDAFLTLLKRDGTMVLVGAPASPHPSPQVFNLIMKRRALAGSMIGGIPETQEMLDFCAQHGIVADIEMIRADEINAAYERMLQGDVKYRFVIDSATLAGGAGTTR